MELCEVSYYELRLHISQVPRYNSDIETRNKTLLTLSNTLLSLVSRAATLKLVKCLVESCCEFCVPKLLIVASGTTKGTLNC